MNEQFLNLENIFTKEECDFLIKKYDSDLRKLTVEGKTESIYSEVRTAHGTFIHEKDEILERFKKLVSEVTKLPIKNQEEPHFVKYEVGGEYKPHYDFFSEKAGTYDQNIARGGQRVFSSILYLNDNFEGGETDFPKLGITVKPCVGNIFTWRNMNADGSLNMNSHHAGLPVKSGVKYIIIIWTRQEEFNKNPKNISSQKMTMPNYTISNGKDKFEELGYTYVSNIVDKNTCVEFAKEMFYLKFSNKLKIEQRHNLAAMDADPNVFRPSYGLGNIKKFDDYLKFISKDLSDKIGVSWKDMHTYTRIYYNGSHLGRHLDRSGLDYTLSVTLFSTIENEWPLYCIDKKQNEIAVHTDVGDGLLILGTKMQHWRKPLVCGSDQCVVQMFMHWSY